MAGPGAWDGEVSMGADGAVWDAGSMLGLQLRAMEEGLPAPRPLLRALAGSTLQHLRALMGGGGS